MSVLCAEDLGLRLGTRAIFGRVELALEAGSIVSLVGPSGSGKSSLLRVLAGLCPATTGRVLLHGSPLMRPVRNVALAFQTATLLPWLSVEDNVALGLTFERPAIARAERRARAREALEEVGLSAARALRPSQLSGGMAQRAALARCLVRRPEVLLLDEPFSALDEVTRAQLHALLKQLVRAHGTATLLVTHDIDEALALSDQVLVLGGEPASLVTQVRVTVPEPRAEHLLELEALRLPILRALSAAHRGNRPLRLAEAPAGEPICATIR